MLKSYKKGRPCKGNEVRQTTSIRLEPSDKEKIKLIFGSVQVWVDQCLEVLNKTKVKNGSRNSYMQKV